MTLPEIEWKKLNGKSVLAEIIRQFGIETIKIEIEDEMRNTILEAQKRQTMVNAEVKTNNRSICVFVIHKGTRYV